jgi:hypothetical protein
MHAGLPRLLRRALSRIVRREELWGGNRETLRNVFFSRDSLLPYSVRTHRRRRGLYPTQLASFNRVRPRSQREVGGLPQERRALDLTSATHAAARSPSQIGVRRT